MCVDDYFACVGVLECVCVCMCMCVHVYCVCMCICVCMCMCVYVYTYLFRQRDRLCYIFRYLQILFRVIFMMIICDINQHGFRYCVYDLL